MLNLRKLSTEALLVFTAILSTRDWKKLTEKDYAEIGLFIASDGCTGVPDFYLNCCIIHDWFYRTHRNLDGTPITKEEADQHLRDCIKGESLFGKFSPMAWWRYWGVKGFGRKAWA